MASVLLPSSRLATHNAGKILTASTRSLCKSTIITNIPGRRSRSKVAHATCSRDKTRVPLRPRAWDNHQHHATIRYNRQSQNISSINNLSGFATLRPDTMKEPVIHHLFEPTSGTWQYIVADPATSRAVVIDPVLNYDLVKSKVSTESADAILALVGQQAYKVDMILETHAHADHLTAASYLQATLARTTGNRPIIGIGSRIKQVQELFGKRYGVVPDEYASVFDKLWKDDEQFNIGNLSAQAIHLPGHTPDHMGYKISDNVFVGDSIFHIDIGSARVDFPGGSAEAIYKSGRRLLALPDHTKIWVGHDYPPDGRDAPVPYLTVSQQRQENKHFKDGTPEHEFVRMRKERDQKLAAPKLLHQSLQINIRGGKLPKETKEGQRLLHLPLSISGPSW